MTRRVLDPVQVEFIDGTFWRLLHTFVYHVGSPDSSDIVTVPRGFITDFASVPRVLWNLLPPTGPYAPAALIHDRLYQCRLISRSGTFALIESRKTADDILLEAMTVLGVGFFTRYAIYLGVRSGGWKAWGAYREGEAK